MNKQLQQFCKDQYSEFRQHLVDCWGFNEKSLDLVESDLKSTHKQHLGLASLCFVLGYNNDRGIYISSVTEADELAMILTAKGLSNSAYVLMRQCIELTLKHIYFSTHPVEFQWSQNKDGYREIGFQFLLDYLRKTDECSRLEGLDLISDIEGDFHRFSRYVHVQNSKFLAFVQPTLNLKEIADNMAQFTASRRSVVSRLCFLLGLYFKEEINNAQANEVALIKNSVQGSLNFSFKRILA